MSRPIVIRTLLIFLALTSVLRAQCAADHRSNKNGGVLIKDFTIVGTQTLSSTELAEMTAELSGSCFDEDSEEMGERVRYIFQNRGYFSVEVKSVSLKPADPLGVPKSVLLEADVTEGLRYKLAEIGFLKNRSLSAEQLREAFPLKTGEIFETGKVMQGLESVRKLYGTNGFLDSALIPETGLGSNGTVSLKITAEEGPQYRMGKLEILAPKETATRLFSQWKLTEGEVYDQSYVDRYITENRDLLPSKFSKGDVVLGKDCPNAVVHLQLIVDPDENSSRSKPKNIPCESHDGPK